MKPVVLVLLGAFAALGILRGIEMLLFAHDARNAAVPLAIGFVCAAGFWKRWKNIHKSSSDPEKVREALFDSVARNDSEAFTKVCRKHGASILMHFQSWTTLPESVRKDSKARETWVRALMMTAEAFKEAGEPRLFEGLRAAKHHPVWGWGDAVSRAEAASDAGKHDESISILLGILSEMEGMIGSAVDKYRPKVYGELGINYFRLHKKAEATKYILLAVEDCRRTGDQEGVEVYTRNLGYVTPKE